MPKASKSRAFYAVAKGRATGVYDTWEECEVQVKNFNGAKHKKFSTRQDAEDWIRNNNPGAVVETTVVASTSTTTPVVPRYQSMQTGRGAKSKDSDAPEAAAEPSREGWLIVYCDGACKSNGQKNPIAGVGVFWGFRDPKNVAERLPGPVQTNNRAELVAILRALQTAPKNKTPMEIRTDSRYCMDCFDKWLPKWRSNGFKSASGEPVKNVDLIRYIDALLRARGQYGQKVLFKHVYGHMGEEGNENADSLANKGCWLPEVPEPDWAALEQEVLDDMEYWDAQDVFQDELVAAVNEVPQKAPVKQASPSPAPTPAPAPAQAALPPASPARAIFRPSQGALGAQPALPQPAAPAAPATRPTLRETAVQTLEWIHAPGCVAPNPSLSLQAQTTSAPAAVASGSALYPNPQVRSGAQQTSTSRRAGKAAVPELTKEELDEYAKCMLDAAELADEISPPLTQQHSQQSNGPAYMAGGHQPSSIDQEDYAQYMLSTQELEDELKEAEG